MRYFLYLGSSSSITTVQSNSRNNSSPIAGNTPHSTTPLERCGHFIFYFLCFFSGQLMIDEETQEAQTRKWKVFLAIVQLVLITITLVVLNIAALVFDLYLIFGCPFKHCGFVIDPNYTYNMTHIKIPCILKVSLVDSEVQFRDMQKLVITMATLSGTLSYLFMIIALLTNYSGIFKMFLTQCHCSRVLPTHDGPIVNPFLDESTHAALDASHRPAESMPALEESTPASRRPDESQPVYVKVKFEKDSLRYFYLMLFFNLAVFLANSGVLGYLVYTQSKGYNHKELKFVIIDWVGIATMRISQYAAIISCFIFSKVAYGVEQQCNTMKIKYGFGHNNITQLEETDLEYVKLNKSSMEPYRVWFTVHWILYTISAFITIAYLAETIIQRLYGHYCKCDDDCKFFIFYVFLLALEHVLLFLYPCFRAASILEARTKLIEDISNENSLDHSDKYNFLQYMKKQRCGFTLSIFCARIEFGFNLAYISLFIGVLGLVIKLCV